MSLQTWWLFAVTTFLVSSTPGPNMLHILTRSASVGLRRSLPAMAGCAVASGAAMAVSAAGLGAVLIASPALFDVIRYTGVAYLVYLGVMAWRTPAISKPETTRSSLAVTKLALFRGGFLVSASNPKLLLYSASVIPQFIDPGSDEVLQLTIIVATFIVGDVFWYGVYAYGGERLSRYLLHPGVRRVFDRVVGSIFVLFGFALIFKRPA